MHEDELAVMRPRKKNEGRLRLQDLNGARRTNGRSRSPTSSESESDSDVRNNRRRTHAEVIPWAKRVGVDAQRMHVMQASLFRVPEETLALRAMTQPMRRLKLSPVIARKHSRDSEGDGLRIDPRQVSLLCCIIKNEALLKYSFHYW